MMQQGLIPTGLMTGMILGLMSFGVGCGGDAAEDILFDPQQPGEFRALTDQSEQQTLIDDMWQILSAPGCWDASFVGDPTAAGSPAGVAQLSFNGNYQYRYAGSFDTYFGTILLFDVGYYEGYPAAIVETWTGGVEGLVIVNDESFAHVLVSPGGSPYTMTYRPSGSVCL